MELDDATRQDINNQIIENTNRITGLVGKMLELSDANSQTVIERNGLVLALQIAAQAIEQASAGRAGALPIDLDVAPEAEQTMLQTNEQSATRMLVLLLDNAMRFTKEGSIVLKLKADAGLLSFVVEDTGIGVPANEAEHIFEEFVQLDDYNEGTGIGLTVARSLARRLGGDVVLDTTYTAGARFVATLPLQGE
jgi:signal transduction histidine kinase